MSTIPRSRIRIAADLFNYDDLSDALRSDGEPFIPKLRAGDDAQFEIALFNDGALLTNLSGIASVQLEIKPMHAEAPEAFDQDDYEAFDLRGPGADTAPIRVKTLAASELNADLTLIDWDTLAPDHAHAVITLDSAETRLAPGDRWLTLSLTTTDSPARTRTIAAGRLRILGGGASQGAPAPTPAMQYYSASQSDARFARQSENLADLANAASARDNLGLGSAATMDAIDEADFASQSSEHLPTQQSVKHYVDNAVANLETATIQPRSGVQLDGASCSISLGNVFNPDMTTDWSITGWFRATGGSGNRNIIRKAASAPFYLIYVSGSGVLTATISDSANTATVTAGGVVDGQWRHFALVCDVSESDGLRLHLNGALVDTADPTAVGSLANASELFLGSSGGVGGWFAGSLSDFALYSKALSAAEVGLAFSLGARSLLAQSPSVCELILPLDEGVGEQARDASPHHRDGLIMNDQFAHLRPQTSGHVRAWGVDAYNGGSGNRQLIDATRNILPAGAVITAVTLWNNGSAVAELDCLRSNRSASEALTDATITIPSGAGARMPSPAGAQSLSYRNVVAHSADVNATQLDLRVDYTTQS